MPEHDRPSPEGDGPKLAAASGHATQQNKELSDLALLKSCVDGAGEIARKFYDGDCRRWAKPGGSPVTEADLAVDTFLKETLLAARPAYAWLSEESVDDPARLNGEAIHVHDRDRIEGCRMLGPKSIFAGWPQMEITSYSSIAYRVALVAAGRHDAMISLTTKHDWDLAAADLIVQEAGGLLSDEAGNRLIYNRASALQRVSVAAGPKLHAALLARLRQKEVFGLPPIPK